MTSNILPVSIARMVMDLRSISITWNSSHYHKYIRFHCAYTIYIEFLEEI